MKERFEAFPALRRIAAESIPYPTNSACQVCYASREMADDGARAALKVSTITVSDTRTAATDEGGKKLRELWKSAGFALGSHFIVKDEPELIRQAIERCAGEDADVIVTTGGTGIAPRDQTYEALEGMLEKRIDGFGEAFRRLSWEAIGPKAILSRAVAGTFRGRILAALPGSPSALGIAVDVLAPVVVHAIGLLRPSR